MRKLAMITTALCAAAVMSGAGTNANASAAANTLLACKLDEALDSFQKVDVANTTKHVLAPQTIVNVVVYTTKPSAGESDDCFALDAPLPASGRVSHIVKLLTQSGAKSCKAFISDKYPTVFRDSDGSMTTQCDY